MHTEHVPFTPESQAYSARAWGAKDATWGLQPHLKPNHKQDFKTFLFLRASLFLLPRSCRLWLSGSGFVGGM